MLTNTLKNILVLLLILFSLNLSIFAKDNHFKGNVKVSLDSEKDIIKALKEIKEENESTYNSLIALRKLNKKNFKLELRKEYYNLLLKKGYRSIQDKRKPTLMEKERMIKKEIKMLSKDYNIEKDQIKKDEIYNKMLEKANNIISFEVEKDSRLIDSLKKRIKIIEGRRESKIKNKDIHAKRLIKKLL